MELPMETPTSETPAIDTYEKNHGTEEAIKLNDKPLTVTKMFDILKEEAKKDKKAEEALNNLEEQIATEAAELRPDDIFAQMAEYIPGTKSYDRKQRDATNIASVGGLKTRRRRKRRSSTKKRRRRSRRR